MAPAVDRPRARPGRPRRRARAGRGRRRARARRGGGADLLPPEPAPAGAAAADGRRPVRRGDQRGLPRLAAGRAPPHRRRRPRGGALALAAGGRRPPPAPGRRRAAGGPARRRRAPARPAGGLRGRPPGRLRAGARVGSGLPPGARRAAAAPRPRGGGDRRAGRGGPDAPGGRPAPARGARPGRPHDPRRAGRRARRRAGWWWPATPARPTWPRRSAVRWPGSSPTPSRQRVGGPGGCRTCAWATRCPARAAGRASARCRSIPAWTGWRRGAWSPPSNELAGAAGLDEAA